MSYYDDIQNRNRQYQRDDEEDYGSEAGRNRGWRNRSFGRGNRDRDYGRMSNAGYGQGQDYGNRSYRNQGYDSDYDAQYSGSSSGRDYGYGDDYNDQTSGGGYRGSYRYGTSTGRGQQNQGRYYGRGPQGYSRSDENIREDVNERLTYHGDIDATNIQVKVENGEVTLEGKVADRQQKRMAEDAAEQVRGVNDVHNRLTIDKNLLEQIGDALNLTGDSGNNQRNNR
jgi:hypothetical protein